MAKESIEVLIEGGKATAAPPLGPKLGPLKVNIGQVVSDINKKTSDFKGMQVPVTVIVDTDTKEFTIKIGTPPASQLIKQEAGIKSGSAVPQSDFVADFTIDQVKKVANMKADGLLGATIKTKSLEILGTMNAMGVTCNGLKAIKMIKEIKEGKHDTAFN
ncbi:50S ribosomal protein L11 [Candidatus Woesearchaeota archaeon]|jgi:large subunit ribosomal protein L11|nr:50S ribosomal protein L11 [Candidatus Woesearchaeota archaeon]MBT4387814.1 50S ribosomal protein L11 [Candidatus Woesearchaeota archaeon]MBT4595633.1 50S ribosomal protein L11 [Candidatus Woesearchaeota archaeon]MBT5740884.1 50S ribosomal protein L11 [Candidatus Woesearchaeota archaeon]MBT6505181.1 50S ribosomal protein L11 [Candidatus Woesearchaeota archaeon]